MISLTIEEIFANITTIITDNSMESIGELESYFTCIKNYINQNEKDKDRIEKEFIHIIQSVQMNDIYFIYVCSAMLHMFNRDIYAELILEAAINSSVFDFTNRMFVKTQLEFYLFRNPSVENEQVIALMNELYQKLDQEATDMICLGDKKLECSNKKKVIVMTSQVLGLRHPPTHSTLERVKYLCKNGYEVEVISSKEGHFTEGGLFFFDTINSNITDDLNGIHNISFDGVDFSIFQSKYDTNTILGIKDVLDYVISQNPSIVIYVGRKGVIPDIVNMYIPVVTVSTVFSTIPDANTDYIITAGNVANYIANNKFTKVIQVPFTFELKDKVKDYTREELGIPADRFIVAVIGNRLDADVDQAFIDQMKTINNIFIVFIGTMDLYDDMCIKNKWLVENSKCLGYVTDVLGICECVDLYVNPRRLGGGFSVVEAMRAGCPAVTLNYGDVSVAAGQEFIVDTYDDMVEMIKRYQADETFYKEMQQIAKDRVRYITNGEKIFIDTIEDIISDIAMKQANM